ncbi:mdj1 protein precursor [Coemansia sp. RSA 1199]|nr:mdj1 protein precursor [Coemansia sp. RSA 1199]
MQSVGKTVLRRLACLSNHTHNRRTVHSWPEAKRLISKLKTDAYTTLRVSETSTSSEIKHKYYNICRQLHPDTRAEYQEQVPPLLNINQPQWQAMSIEQRQHALRDQFSMARDAYVILSDENIRQQYNAMRQHKSAHLGSAKADVWGNERPVFTGQRYRAEEKRRLQLLTFGVFGFIGVVLVVDNYLQQLLAERKLQWEQNEHQQCIRILDTARERALEKWREVPPNHLGEFEARRLRSSQINAHNEEVVGQGEFHKLWPHGAGLGLISVLDDDELCGIHARMQIATDESLARIRPSAQRMLAKDPIVCRYMHSDQPLRSTHNSK